MRDGREFYCSLIPSNASGLEGVRNAVYEAAGAPEGYSMVDPHVTLHPGLVCGESGAAAAASVACHAIGDELRFGPLEVFPGPEDPAVVMLSVEDRLSVYRRAAEAAVRDRGGSVSKEPVPAHLTLFKRDAGSGGVDEGRARALDGDAWNVRDRTVAGVSVKTRR